MAAAWPAALELIMIFFYRDGGDGGIPGIGTSFVVLFFFFFLLDARSGCT